MLLHRGRVANLLVAARELEVREADRARVVRLLGVPQRPAVQRDGARLLAARRGDAPVQPPEVREQDGGDGFAQRVGRAAERGARLIDVVLQQPRFGEGRPDASARLRA